ncbi:MAG: discoidin domain-containing protein [Sandaracinaceae bacterium]
MSALEALLFRRATRLAGDVIASARDDARDELERGTSRLAAAETLWAANARAQAIAMCDGGLEDVIGAARRAFGVELGAALEKCGLSARERGELEAAAHGLDGASRDAIAIDVTASGARFDARMRAGELLARRLRPCLMTADERATTSRRRIAVLGGLTAALAACAMYVQLTRPPTIHATASAYKSGEGHLTYPPENAIDGQEMSYWLLPPGETGWIELSLDAPRSIEALRILNGHDYHLRDRARFRRPENRQAANAIHVVAYAGSHVVAEADAELSPMSDWDRETIPLVASNVDRIRIEVRSFHGDGGGFAEVELLP